MLGRNIYGIKTEVYGLIWSDGIALGNRIHRGLFYGQLGR